MEIKTIWCIKHENGYIDLSRQYSYSQAKRQNEELKRLKYEHLYKVVEVCYFEKENFKELAKKFKNYQVQLNNSVDSIKHIADLNELEAKEELIKAIDVIEDMQEKSNECLEVYNKWAKIGQFKKKEKQKWEMTN